MSNINYDKIINDTKEFIDLNLMPIINNLGEELEGNLFMYHLTKTYLDNFTVKQKNLVLLSNQNNVKEVLEIGFNSGFSAVLLLNSNPNINLTCVDICIHSYSIPCYNKIKEFYGDRINLQIGSSVDVVPKLPKLYDLIHIDGAHQYSIALEDIINSYYISSRKSILIMDDYDIPVLNNLWNEYSKIFNLTDLSFDIFINPYQSIKQVNKYNYLDNISNDKNIPKIIHQIAPSDKSNWHPVWEECQKTWLINFPSPEYEYKLWNDEEDLENLIKNDFPFFLDIFKNYSRKIQRIDMARYFILFKYGGIYADMDFYCYKNFYNTLDMTKPNITCSPWKDVEFLQNSLMASPKGNFVFLDIIDVASKRNFHELVSNSTGPKLISDVYDRLTSFINPLDLKLYNPIGCKSLDNIELYNENTCYCKHYGTGKW
jgi:mannosyltransferase OCH1-like enzyme